MSKDFNNKFPLQDKTCWLATFLGALTTFFNLIYEVGYVLYIVQKEKVASENAAQIAYVSSTCLMNSQLLQGFSSPTREYIIFATPMGGNKLIKQSDL